MRILISNDDGLFAPGLAALAHAVHDLGQITVVAPDSPQSAAGHAITLRHPLTVRRVQVGGAGGFVGHSVDGRPADCVRLAVRKLMDAPPDLVLSGINAGTNVGINVFYSGTVAAAAEAAMFLMPAVAFSARIDEHADFDRIARLCRWVLDGLLARGLAPGELVNVNIPSLAPGRPKGVRVVPQSTAGLIDEYEIHESAEDREVYRLSDHYEFEATGGETDVTALFEGYITVTPLKVDMTDHTQLPALRTRTWGEWPKAGE